MKTDFTTVVPFTGNARRMSELFFLPLKQVSTVLVVGITTLKRICRKINLGRWPHRKLACLQKQLACLSQAEQNSSAECKVSELRAQAINVEITKLTTVDPKVETEFWCAVDRLSRSSTCPSLESSSSSFGCPSLDSSSSSSPSSCLTPSSQSISACSTTYDSDSEDVVNKSRAVKRKYGEMQQALNSHVPTSPEHKSLDAKFNMTVNMTVDTTGQWQEFFAPRRVSEELACSQEALDFLNFECFKSRSFEIDGSREKIFGMPTPSDISDQQFLFDVFQELEMTNSQHPM